MSIGEVFESVGAVALVLAGASLAYLLSGPFAIPASLAVLGAGLLLLSILAERARIKSKGGDE